MMAGVILVFSLVVLLQFFVSYCRSLIAASSREPLSREVQEVTGISRTAPEGDFSRVVQLLYLCPDRPEERGQLRAVGAYYKILGFVRATLARMSPALRGWTERERSQCTYYAAVVLGRRIAFSRDMLAEQMLP
ncbi:MAG TPA: hypothetical protein VMT51_05375 [Dongiaceae bacterium]|nr:hypothetical protein [Dongiaceae bacterium]